MALFSQKFGAATTAAALLAFAADNDIPAGVVVEEAVALRLAAQPQALRQALDQALAYAAQPNVAEQSLAGLSEVAAEQKWTPPLKDATEKINPTWLCGSKRSDAPVILVVTPGVDELHPHGPWFGKLCASQFGMRHQILETPVGDGWRRATPEGPVLDWAPERGGAGGVGHQNKFGVPDNYIFDDGSDGCRNTSTYGTRVVARTVLRLRDHGKNIALVIFGSKGAQFSLGRIGWHTRQFGSQTLQNPLDGIPIVIMNAGSYNQPKEWFPDAPLLVLSNGRDAYSDPLRTRHEPPLQPGSLHALDGADNSLELGKAFPVIVEGAEFPYSLKDSKWGYIPRAKNLLWFVHFAHGDHNMTGYLYPSGELHPFVPVGVNLVDLFVQRAAAVRHANGGEGGGGVLHDLTDVETPNYPGAAFEEVLHPDFIADQEARLELEAAIALSQAASEPAPAAGAAAAAPQTDAGGDGVATETGGAPQRQPTTPAHVDPAVDETPTPTSPNSEEQLELAVALSRNLAGA